jgi:hypothetical protein
MTLHIQTEVGQTSLVLSLGLLLSPIWKHVALSPSLVDPSGFLRTLCCPTWVASLPDIGFKACFFISAFRCKPVTVSRRAQKENSRYPFKREPGHEATFIAVLTLLIFDSLTRGQ